MSKYNRYISLGQRFERNVSPEPNSGCFLWCGAANARGYGVIRSNGRSELAHRIAWIQCYGEIPIGMYILHACDNSACVNPKHLFVGTHTDNMRDALKKGRHAASAMSSCKRGHAFDETNTLRYRNKRICRCCSSMRRDAIRARAALAEVGK